jgi:hypothetical protein
MQINNKIKYSIAEIYIFVDMKKYTYPISTNIHINQD